MQDDRGAALAHGTGHGSDVGEILAVAWVTMHDNIIDFTPDGPGPVVLDRASANGHDAGLVKADGHEFLGNRTLGNSLSINGTAVVEAHAHGDSAGSVIAFALAPEEAKGTQIQSLTILASASGSQVAGNMIASAALLTHDGNHGIVIGGLDIEAKADGIHVGGSVCACATGSFSDAGPLSITGATKILATASGNGANGVHALSRLFADTAHNTALSETFGPIDVEAHADVGAGGAASANAVATVNLTPLGAASILGANTNAAAITVLASADPLDHAGMAFGGASLNVDAAGKLFIRGNVTVQALALGNGVFDTDHRDIADAVQRLQGSSVAINGNLRSLALADGSWGRAEATIELHADGNPGNIHLIELQDPLAQASAGAVSVIRQSHASTSGSALGTLHSTAAVDIDIGFHGSINVAAPP